jgi:hypothetical protein
MDSPLRDRYPSLKEHAVHSPSSVQHTHSHTHTNATGRPQPCLSCNTFHRTFQPAGSCRSKTLKDLVFLTSVHDHNRYATAHALTLALIFRRSISSFTYDVFLFGERKVHNRNAVEQSLLAETSKFCKEDIKLFKIVPHKTKVAAI